MKTILLYLITLIIPTSFTYTDYAKVTEINQNEVTFINQNDTTYTYYFDEEELLNKLEIGKNYVLQFDDLCTKDMEDDIIFEVEERK